MVISEARRAWVEAREAPSVAADEYFAVDAGTFAAVATVIS